MNKPPYKQFGIYVPIPKQDSIRQIQDACKKFSISFSSLVIDLTIIGFEEGRWSALLDKNYKKNIVTTADIVHDSMQDELTGDEKWMRL